MGQTCCAPAEEHSYGFNPGLGLHEVMDSPNKKAEPASTAETSEESSDDEGAEMPEPPQYNRGPRASVSAEAYGQWNQKKAFTPPKHDKDAPTKERIRHALKDAWMFAALDAVDRERVIDAFKKFPCKAGTTVIQQGAEEANELYLVESGELVVYKSKSGAAPVQVYQYDRPGNFFGELALLYNCPRAATVKAKTDCLLWSIDRETFNHLVKDAAMKKRQRYEDFLASVELLSHLDTYERSKISDAIKTRSYSKDDYIIRQNEEGEEFYILEKGSAKALKNGVEVMSYTDKSYFGELSLIKKQVRAADVKVTSDKADVLILDRESFTRLMGPLDEMMKNRATDYKK